MHVTPKDPNFVAYLVAFGFSRGTHLHRRGAKNAELSLRGAAGVGVERAQGGLRIRTGLYFCLGRFIVFEKKYEKLGIITSKPRFWLVGSPSTSFCYFLKPFQKSLPLNLDTSLTDVASWEYNWVERRASISFSYGKLLGCWKSRSGHILSSSRSASTRRTCSWEFQLQSQWFFYAYLADFSSTSSKCSSSSGSRSRSTISHYKHQ